MQIQIVSDRPTVPLRSSKSIGHRIVGVPSLPASMHKPDATTWMNIAERSPESDTDINQMQNEGIRSQPPPPSFPHRPTTLHGDSYQIKEKLAVSLTSI